MKKIQAQDRLPGEKFKFLYSSKHSSLVKLGVVWLNVKTYQTDCPVKNKNFRIDWVNHNVSIFITDVKIIIMQVFASRKFKMLPFDILNFTKL